MSHRLQTTSMYGMDIYDREDYLYYNFQWDAWDFPKITVYLGPFYYIPTFMVVGRMFYVYYTMRGAQRAGSIQKWLFLSFLLMQIGNFSYIITDFLVLRIPATGVLTSLCAATEPNQLLKLPYLIAFISSYLSMLYPCIFCANRAIIVFYPKDHMDISARVMKICLPITVILPICLTVAMIPTVGHCTQLTAPYPKGAIMFTLDMKVPINEYTHLLTSMFCTIFTFSINITMLIKVRHILFNKSLFNRNKNYKAELSLTITMVSLFIPFLINGIVVILSLRDPSLIGYILSIRPIGIDSATVFVPWAFYLTHPMFRRKTAKTSSAVAIQLSTVNSSVS